MRLEALFVFFILFFHCSIAQGKSDTDSLFHELNKAIGTTKVYDGRKYERIERVKSSFKTANNDLSFQYDFYLKLYEEYKVFKFDTAFFYAQRLNEIAKTLDDPFKIAQSQLKSFFVLLSAGMYKESSDLMSDINIEGQPDSIKAEYYFLKARYYFDLADYDNDRYHTPAYFSKGSEYLDSALIYFPAHSFESAYLNGLKNLKTENLGKAFSYFQTLLSNSKLTEHQLAIVASTLGYIYIRRNETDKAIEYQIRAAIADIKSSTKETFATFNLAQILFERGDFENAYVSIEKAIGDASFYGARQRKVQVSAILPIIQSAKLKYIENQRKTLIVYGAIATFFLVVSIVLLLVIYKQYNKLKHAKKVILEANIKLQEINNELQNVNAQLQNVNAQLQEANARLSEANKIKEEYIGYFFSTNSEYFQKIEKFKKVLEQKIAERRLDDLRFVVNNINIKKEKEELLKNFDRIFLKLFPNFVAEFNKLFEEEDQVRLKDNEFLNTELRIFALIRMGITDNEKIAQILEYSVSTIYNYKTKMKMRSNVSKELFRKRIMDIKSI